MVAQLTGRTSLRAAIGEVASRDPVLADLTLATPAVWRRTPTLAGHAHRDTVAASVKPAAY